MIIIETWYYCPSQRCPRQGGERISEYHWRLFAALMSAFEVRADSLARCSECLFIATSEHSHLFALPFDWRTMIRCEIAMSGVHVGD